MTLPRPLLVLFLCAATLLAGCASFDSQPYNSAANSRIKRVGIVTPGVQEKLAIRIFNHPGNSFGLLGALVAAGDESGKAGRLTELARGNGYDHRNDFQRRMAIAVQDAGFEPVLIQVYNREDGEFLQSYPSGSEPVDAYLDLYAFNFGYTAAGATTPYRPTLTVVSRLVDADSESVLFADRIMYNPYGNTNDALTINADDSYSFKGFDDIQAAPVQAVDGLKVAVEEVGSMLTRQLQ